MKLKKLVVVGLTMMMVGLTACGGDDGGSNNEEYNRYLESSDKEKDTKNLDEVVAQVKNCISDASICEIKVVLGDSGTTATYTFTKYSAESDENGTEEFAELVLAALDGASTTSKVNPEKDAIKVSITLKDNGGYDVKADFTRS